jgi:hypothetical protein
MNVVVNIPNFYDGNESSVTGEFIGKVEYKTIYNQYGSTFVSEPLDLIVNKKYTGLTSSYFTDYNNGDIGNVTDSTIINRNTILDLNNQERFRSIAINSSGSLYPTGSSRSESSTDNLQYTASFPSTVSGLQLWLDANDSQTITASGTTLTTWKNKSSVSKTITIGGSPQVISNALNSRKGIRFTTSDSFRETTNYSAPVTVAYIGKLTGGANSRMLQSVSNNWLLGAWGGYINQAYFEGWVAGPYGSAADTTVRFYTATIGGSGVNTFVYSNTASIASNQGGITGPNGITVNNSSTNPTENSNCEIYELVIYNKILSTTERFKLWNYFSAKWALGGISANYYGVGYSNSNILNIRFVNGSISGSNKSNPNTGNIFLSATASQDLLVTNIVGAVNNGYINTISSGSSKTIRRLDGITNKTDFTGDEYSNVSFTTKGTVDKTYVMSTDVEFFTKVSEFVPLINPSIVYEVDFNNMLNVQIDNTATIVALYNAPVGFYISSDKLNLVGYVNFTEQITMRVKLSNSVTYNVIIKPIFMRSKYTYTI